MPAPNTTTPILDQKAALMKRVRSIVSRFSVLNDPEYVRDKTIAQLNSTLTAYKKSLNFAFDKFYKGQAIDKVVKQSVKDFKSETSSYTDLLKPKDGQLKRMVKSRFVNQMRAISSEIIGRQKQKLMQFKIMLPKEASKAEARRLWDLYTKRNGSVDSVQFRNGTKYPLKAFANMKATTSANETGRLATALESSRNGIYTGKISSHGAKDSCRLHEGEIVFMSAEAKRQYMKEFPEDSRASKFRTLEEVESDRTHMFLPNCKHKVNPYPIQFFTEEDRQEEVESNVVSKIPKKVRA